MNKKDFIILVDMDDTIENLKEAWVNRLNSMYGYNIDFNDITEWDMGKTFTTLTSYQILEPLSSNNFWEYVTPKKDAMIYLKKLYDEGFTIKIVTHSHYSTINEKFTKALFPYFPFISSDDIIICKDKWLIKGDILIDDAIHNLEKFSGYKVLLTAPHNKLIKEDNTIFRANNWQQIYSYIELCYAGTFINNLFKNTL